MNTLQLTGVPKKGADLFRVALKSLESELCCYEVCTGICLKKNVNTTVSNILVREPMKAGKRLTLLLF